MKKILFLLIAALAIVFTSCDPMEEINNDIDKDLAAADKDALFLKDLEIAPEAYTLTDEDYELSSDEGVAKYKNFSAYALPKDHLPEILNQKFSGEDAQAMMVTYNFYSKPAVDKDNAYVISDDEYDDMGASYGSFDNEDEAEALIGKLLDRKVYAEEAGAEMTVEYILYTKNEDRFIQVNADSTSEEVGYTSDAVVVTDDIYEATGNTYYSFTYISDALEDLAKYAVDSAVALPITYSALVYKNYIPTYVVYMHNGTNWLVKQSLMPTSEPLNYALDAEDISQSYWWADPAIKIALTSEDYASNEFTAKYGNFDLRSGNTPGTDEDMLIDMLGEMLDLNHNAVENQQYLVSYAYYDGSNGVGTMRIIKEGGDWKEYSE